MWNVKRVRTFLLIHSRSLPLPLSLYISHNINVYIVYNNKDTTSSVKITFNIFRASVQMCVCICFFYFFSFYWHNFFGQNHVEFDGKWVWLFVCLFLFVSCVERAIIAKFSLLWRIREQTSKPASDETIARARKRATKNLCDNFPGVANVLCANYTI